MLKHWSTIITVIALINMFSLVSFTMYSRQWSHEKWSVIVAASACQCFRFDVWQISQPLITRHDLSHLTVSLTVGHQCHALYLHKPSCKDWSEKYGGGAESFWQMMLFYAPSFNLFYLTVPSLGYVYHDARVHFCSIKGVGFDTNSYHYGIKSMGFGKNVLL